MTHLDLYNAMHLSAPPDIEENNQLSAATLNWIAGNNLWNLWVPRDCGGLEADLLDGLRTLQSLARIDGSLGWTVTLCAGANFFIGNLQPDYAKSVFNHQPVIMGGSGGIFGTAVETREGYQLNGHWRYATGAPYLTHFTLNAQLHQHGRALEYADGTPVYRSFVVPAEQVKVVNDWQTMGLQATATHSFIAENLMASPLQTFQYEKVYLPQPLYRLNFSVFADLTLWVNYIGMAEHLLDVTADSKVAQRTALQAVVAKANADVEVQARHCSALVKGRQALSEQQIADIHRIAAMSVAQMSSAIISLYPCLGIAGATENNPVNQIFRDYFTATQHHIFTR